MVLDLADRMYIHSIELENSKSWQPHYLTHDFTIELSDSAGSNFVEVPVGTVDPGWTTGEMRATVEIAQTARYIKFTAVTYGSHSCGLDYFKVYSYGVDYIASTANPTIYEPGT
jgi:hypothetical protein